ncbi:thymidine phosphorylase [Candidatus Dojkabacteria bacterium]|nr:thymidine phosphorylase [Candidatus Dojkabacteria bacterium]
MKFFLAAKKLDINSGDELICIINEADANEYGVGVNVGDRVSIKWSGLAEPLVATIDTTQTLVDEGEIGIYEDIWQKNAIKDKTVIEISLLDQIESAVSIRKKLLGEKLDYKDFFYIMRDIANGKLNEVLIAVFIAAGYSPGFDKGEILLMTKALAMTGEILKFQGTVADKHSIGGIAGKGVTPIVVPIVAANGVIVPNTSTRAVTSASATTDMLEVIMPMVFNRRQLEEMVDKNGAFMVWGGGLDLAPADDEIIRYQKHIGIESIDKFVSSIMAKKIAQGVNHVIFDVPIGPSSKIHEGEFDKVKNMFDLLGMEFGVKVNVYKRQVMGIDGNAVGPALECKEFLRVYEQHPQKSQQLENSALEMAGILLEMVGKAQKGGGFDLAQETLYSGKAEKKFREIVEAQGGDVEVTSDSLEVGGIVYEYKAPRSGVLESINNKRIFEVAKALGNPRIKESGLYVHMQPGQQVKSGDLLATLYAASDIRLELGKKVIDQNKVFVIK